MVGGLLDAAQFVVDAGFGHFILEGIGSHDEVDAKTPVLVKPLGAVVKPGEALALGGVGGAEGVGQAEPFQTGHPLALDGQEGALAIPQPALAVRLADADVEIGGGDVHIPDQHKLIARGVMSLEVVLQVFIELLLGRELGLVILILPLREVAVHHLDEGAIFPFEGGHDHPALGLFRIGGEALFHLDRLLLAHDGHPVVGLLAVEFDVITHGFHVGEGEGLVVNLDLLQADHIGLVLVDDGLQLMQTGAQAVDIERDDLHVRDAHVIFISGLLD